MFSLRLHLHVQADQSRHAGRCQQRETAIVGIEPVTEMPEHDLGRWFQPALLNGPVGGGMAHGATLVAWDRLRVTL